MAIGVVIPALTSHEFIACDHHGHAHRQHVDGCKVFDLTFAQIVDPLVIRFTFSSAVPAAVVVYPIVIAFTIGPVVFFVVGSQVV